MHKDLDGGNMYSLDEVCEIFDRLIAAGWDEWLDHDSAANNLTLAELDSMSRGVLN